MRLAILALALIGAAAAATAQNAPLALQPGETLMEVEARGIRPVRPDVMTVSASVVTTGATAREALDANSALARRLIEAVRARGVGARDVRTSSLRVMPTLSRREERTAETELREPRIIGYTAQNQVAVRVRELRDASTLLDSLIAAGANRIEGPRFSLSDDSSARAAARREAVRLARQQAETYADAVGMRVARILRMSERRRSIGNDGDQIIVTGSLVRGAPIEPGEIEVAVTLWVDFALAPR